MDHLDTFADWLKYQQFGDLEGQPEEVVATLRGMYEHDRNTALTQDVHAMVPRPPRAGEHHYAVAIEDGAALWLTLWIRRSRNGECFILYPRTPESDPHASYHCDGRYHQKSYNHKSMVQQRQPLDQFKHAEHLGSFYGHGPGAAVCDPAAFTSVLRVPMGILEATRGSVLVDLVEPGCAPAVHHRTVPGLRIVAEETYRDSTPWIVVAVAEQTPV